MPDKLKRTIIGAVIAVALAAAVSYGLISQQTADKIEAEANQTLQTDPGTAAPTPQQPAPRNPAPQDPSAQGPAPAPAPQGAPTARP